MLDQFDIHCKLPGDYSNIFLCDCYCLYADLDHLHDP